MIAFPTPFFARNAAYKGPVEYAAMASTLQILSDRVTTDLHSRVSPDGLDWFKFAPRGDIGSYFSSAGPGAFYAQGMISAFGRTFVYGRIWVNLNDSKTAVFGTDDGKAWDRIETPLDSVAGDRYFVDAAILSGKLTLLCNSGELAISTDGETFSSRANVGFVGTSQARAIVAGTGIIVAAGRGGQGFSATDPSGTWTSRNLQFSASDITHLAAGNVLAAAGSGKLATSALNSGTAWTAQTDPVGGVFDFLEHGNGRWFASGLSAKWITSTTGAAWSTPANKPMVAERVRSGLWDGSRWLLFLSGGVLATSEDGITWSRVTDSGLAAVDYLATAKLP